MKRYLSMLVITIMLCVMLFGCVDNDPDVDMSTDVELTDDSTEEVTEEQTESPTINLTENAIWKKDKQELSITTVSFTNEWDKYIMVGDKKVVSDSKTDVFELPNYFYSEGESYADLETIYYVPTYRYNLSSILTQFDTHVRSVLHVYSTSDVTTNPHGAIIESIQYLSVVNPNDGGLTSLINMACYDDGSFGIGSTKKAIYAVLGEPTNSFIEEMSNGVNLTTEVYVGEKTQLMLSYMWLKSDGEENSILTTIKWDLTDIATYLHNQENADKFEGRETFTDHENNDSVIETDDAESSSDVQAPTE